MSKIPVWGWVAVVVLVLLIVWTRMNYNKQKALNQGKAAGENTANRTQNIWDAYKNVMDTKFTQRPAVTITTIA